MNRRGFFKALGAAIAIVAAPPVPVVNVVKPAALPVTAAGGSWIDMANAIAFNMVGEILPEHQGHYRRKAMLAAHRYVHGPRTPYTPGNPPWPEL